MTLLCKDTNSVWENNKKLFTNYEEHWFPGRQNLLKLLHKVDKNKYLRFLYLSELVFHMFWIKNSSVDKQIVYETKMLEKLVVTVNANKKNISKKVGHYKNKTLYKQI